MKKLTKLFGALAVVTASVLPMNAVSAAPAGPAPRPMGANQDDCDATFGASFGWTYACWDQSTAFLNGNPAIFIFTGSSQPSFVFSAVSLLTSGPGGCAATAAEWQPNGGTSTKFIGGCLNGFYTLDGTVWANCNTQNYVWCVYNSSKHDLLEWYSTAAGYEFAAVP